ncbi:YwpF family protein [Shouchella lonarensis]|uniref:YwpF-like protein n=1 Tax=Shouchella lonarensis TaxID=1464122 RepID=A0A1G6MG88_9BACI|nr:YwpF family protein [Shouchella lonarensis]SDC54297.1 YwpF-like protein [Shouchella lonarensis]
MKTYKLHALQVIEEQDGHVKQRPIPLEDGLIINMENKERVWFVDAVVSASDVTSFEQIYEKGQHMLISVVITSKNNHPAVMFTSIESITDLNEGKGIVFKGKIIFGRDDVLKDVFKDLLKNDYNKDEMLGEFKRRVEQVEGYSEQTIQQLYHMYQNLES